MEPERTLLAVHAERFVGGCAAFGFELSVPGPAIVRAAGVTAVGVLPTDRTRGDLRADRSFPSRECRPLAPRREHGSGTRRACRGARGATHRRGRPWGRLPRRLHVRGSGAGGPWRGARAGCSGPARTPLCERPKALVPRRSSDRWLDRAGHETRTETPERASGSSTRTIGKPLVLASFPWPLRATRTIGPALRSHNPSCPRVSGTSAGLSTFLPRSTDSRSPRSCRRARGRERCLGNDRRRR